MRTPYLMEDEIDIQPKFEVVQTLTIEKRKLGLIHQFVKDANAYIAIDDRCLLEDQKKKLETGIPYISTFDFI